VDGIDLGRLSKLLALADSDKAGEAANALRAAGKQLRNAGRGWGDLGRWVEDQASGPSGRRGYEAGWTDGWDAGRRDAAARRRDKLAKELEGEREARRRAERDLANERARHDRDRNTLSRTIEELGRRLGRAVAERKRELDGLRAEHRRQTAAIRAERDRLASRQTPERRRAEVRRLLEGGGLTDREIARRVGVSPQTVGNLRRKAARGAGDQALRKPLSKRD
jgi:DNA-binding CsgD family transcriptional regulator